MRTGPRFDESGQLADSGSLAEALLQQRLAEPVTGVQPRTEKRYRTHYVGQPKHTIQDRLIYLGLVAGWGFICMTILRSFGGPAEEVWRGATYTVPFMLSFTLSGLISRSPTRMLNGTIRLALGLWVINAVLISMLHSMQVANMTDPGNVSTPSMGGQALVALLALSVLGAFASVQAFRIFDNWAMKWGRKVKHA